MNEDDKDISQMECVDTILLNAIPFCVGFLIGAAMGALVIKPEWFGV